MHNINVLFSLHLTFTFFKFCIFLIKLEHLRWQTHIELIIVYKISTCMMAAKLTFY